MKVPAPVTTPAISRVAISWICVATNDGHPLHLDHEFARAAGFRDVVVPGHMLIGWIGQYLEDWCGGDPRRLLDWKIRFTAPAWPGDAFTIAGEYAAEDPPSPDERIVHVTATSQEGKVCATAVARLRMPSQ